MKFKYKINDQISLQPRTISIADIVKLVETHGISKNTFHRDRAIPFGSSKSIPSDRLDIYARLFEVTPDDLKNYRVKAVKSIRESLTSKKIKTGLS